MTSVAVVGVLAGFAVAMSVTSAVTVKWAAFAPGPLRASVVQFLLLMMSAMFVGVLVYFAVGGTPGVVAGFWVAAVIMSASVFLVFFEFLRETRRYHDPRAAPERLPSRTVFVGSVVFLVILNEFLMGWSFSLLDGILAPGLGAGGSDTLSVLGAAITSPWFVFPMALEMVITLGWLLPVFPPPMRRYLLVQPAVMVCSPPTLLGIDWVLPTTVAASALMALSVAWLLVALFRDEPLPRSVFSYAVRLILSFGAMAAGLYVWVESGRPEIFALSLLVQMVVFLHAVTDPGAFSSERVADRSRYPRAAVAVGTDRP